MKRVLMIIGAALLFIVGGPPARVKAGGGNPDPADLVPKTVAAGIGQLLTIQGFNLFVPGSTRVTLMPVTGGPPNHCVVVVEGPSSSNELYVLLGVFQYPNPPGCSTPIPSVVPAGRYRLTVTTPAGTSQPIRLEVNENAQTPIPRRLMACPSATVPCTPSSFFRPGDRLGILAYGTDTVGATAVFLQGGTGIPVRSDLTYVGGGSPDPADRGLINTFVVPTFLAPGPALVQLRTTVRAIGGGSPEPSDLSFAIVFTVVTVPSPDVN